MSLLSGYWLLFFHNTKMKLSSSSITQQWMLWCLPFVLNQSIDTYKQKSFLLSNKKCYSLTWPDNERNKGAKTSHCTTCNMALVITSPEIHLKKAVSELWKCEQLVPLLNHEGSVRWKKKAILWCPLKLDWISKQNQFARAILLPLDWFGMTSIFDKLLISGHRCWWKEERILKSKY